MGDREPGPTGPEGYSLSLFVTTNLRRLFATFWGRGAHAHVAFPWSVTLVATLGLVGVIVLASTARSARRLLLVLAIQPTLTAITLALNAHRIYWATGLGDRGIQGRYLYAGIVAVALAVGIVAGLALRGGAAGPRSVAWVVAPATIGALGVAWVVTRTRAAYWDGLDPAILPGVVPVALAVLGAAAVAGLAVTVAGTAGRVPSAPSLSWGVPPGRSLVRMPHEGLRSDPLPQRGGDPAGGARDDPA